MGMAEPGVKLHDQNLKVGASCSMGMQFGLLNSIVPLSCRIWIAVRRCR